MFRPIALGLLLFGLASPAMPVHAADGDSKAGDTILVFDASGSMWGQIDGVAKITIAREVVQGLLDDLPPERRLGLVAYGHRRKGDCKDIETLVPVGDDRAAIAKAIKGMNPVGKTPMTAAVEQAAEALKFTENEATVILVSDGQETCNADPCATAEKLAKLGVGLTVHTVGFGLTKEEAGAKGELKCMAEATGGQFFIADDAVELRDALAKVSAAPTSKKKAAEPEPKPEPEPEPEPEPQAVETGMAKLEATDQDGGPLIKKDLVWTVRHGATGDVLHKSDAGGTADVEIPRGVHDVSVRRGSDGATAEGEINLSGASANVRLPIVVELDATLDVPETADAGSKIRVTWTGPDDEDDYIAVSKVDSSNKSYVNYTRTRAGNPLQLLMPAEAGTYEVRYVSQKNHDVLARESIEVGEISASLEIPETAEAGASLSVTWTGPDYKDDYITVAKVDAASKNYVNYTRTRSGNPLKLLMPAEAGTYEVRYIQNQSKKILATESIEVEGITASLEIPAKAPAGSSLSVTWTGPDYKDDYITVAKVDAASKNYVNYTRTRSGNPLKLLMPAEAGTYEVRYIQNQSKKILATESIEVEGITASLEIPTKAPAGSSLSVTWIGPDYKDDYISVAKVDSAAKNYVNYTRTRSGNPLKLLMPPEAGTYEVRYIQNQSKKLLASQTIETTAVTASLDLPDSGTAGSTIEVVWTGPDYKDDFITVAEVDSPDKNYVNYRRTRAGSPLELKMPDKPGSYEIRYVQRQGHLILASEPFTVKAE